MRETSNRKQNMKLAASAVLLLLASAIVPSLFAESSNGPTATEEEWTVDEFSFARAQSTETDHFVGTLAIGLPIFWDGEFIEDSIGAENGCEAPTARCFSYSFEVPDGGSRLRVAIDTPSATEFFRVNLERPNGEMVSNPFRMITFSTEYFVNAPSAGRWTLHVVGAVVEDATFRMRALLEDAPQTPQANRGPQDLLPNLQFMPAFEFTFEVGIAPFYGPGSNVAGVQPVSCTPGEIANNPNLRRCLRLSFGPLNSGDGPVDMRYRSTGSILDSLDVVQIVHRDDGSNYSRPAGTAQYHLRHAHYHHMGFGAIELHRVDDLKKGETTLVGLGPKQGACLGSYIIVDWHSFAQDQHKATSTCETRGNDNPMQESVFWLSRGYADVYGWPFEDNYVDFGANGDALYLVRATTDPDDVVLETDETDNTGYSLIRVNGTKIEVLERGFGQGPWDNKREVHTDHLLYELADVNWLPYNDAK